MLYKLPNGRNLRLETDSHDEVVSKVLMIDPVLPPSHVWVLYVKYSDFVEIVGVFPNVEQVRHYCLVEYPFLSDWYEMAPHVWRNHTGKHELYFEAAESYAPRSV